MKLQGLNCNNGCADNLTAQLAGYLNNTNGPECYLKVRLLVWTFACLRGSF